MVEESGQVQEVEEQLAQANARISEMEQAVAGKEAEIIALKQSGQEMESKLSSLSKSLSEAVSAYKTVVVGANPEVVAELIGGDSIQAIDESLARARELVSRVRRGVEKEISLARVPAGAPERTLPDLSALSPREKIQYAIGKK